MSGNRSIVVRPRDERGVALIMTMLVMALMSALLIGFSAVVASDQRYRYIDRDRVRAFYAAQSGLEKLSADLATEFKNDVSLSPAQLQKVSENPPAVPDVTFTTGTEDGIAYAATPIPTPEKWSTIASGPYEGLIAMKERYWLDASVRTTSGGEAHLRRKVESVAIPIFQFGIFSDVDLSFSAADTFDFRGRVHTNGNLFLAQGSTSTLWLRDRVTAAEQIVRQRLSNNVSIGTSGSTGRIEVATAPNDPVTGQAFRPLAREEGSVVDGLKPATPNPAWPTLSLSTYKGYLRSKTTGAKKLNLVLMKPEYGGSHIDLIRRPVPNEKAKLLGERNFTKSSLRILLSDTVQDIMTLPTIDTSTQPVSLDGDWTQAAQRPAGYGPIDLAHPPVARTPGAPASNTAINANVLPGTQPIEISALAPFNRTMPAHFLLPVLTVTPNPPVAGGATVTCTGKLATTFTGCVITGGAGPVNMPATVSATLDGFPVSTTLTANWAGGGTITVASTEKFSPNSFWVLNGTNGTTWNNNLNQMIRCEGHTTAGNDRFLNCTVPAIPGAPANTNVLLANAPVTVGSLTDAMSTIGGFIKIEMQVTPGVWRDVTMEVLNYGIGGRNLTGRTCNDPTPSAILRLQRFQDNAEPETVPVTPCSYSTLPRPGYFVPNVLFDAREAIYRDAIPADRQPRLGGVMHYVALDVRNLSTWFRKVGAHAGGTGNLAYKDPDSEGYAVYFSDRRNNRNAQNQETGEYGFEDVVNPNAADGFPNGLLNEGEDMNAGSVAVPVLDNYGQFPSFSGAANASPTGAQGALTSANARPWQPIRAPYAQGNRAVLFRRALKLINGGAGNIVAPGLTVTSENPVYIEGDWNATTGAADPFAGPHVATSVVADAVTLLSNGWNDNNSFRFPYTASGRPRQNSSYRLAIIAGKGPVFPRPTNGEGTTFGTDGGVHSFLRFLEGNVAAGVVGTVNYRGSMATLYYHRQAVSPFKCCGVGGNGVTGGIVYDVPVRKYSFDVDFLDPALLPPLTPLFRDTNALGFTQETRPGK